MTVNPLRRALNLLTAFALVLSQLMLLVPSTAFGAPVVTVNSTGDAGDAAPGDHLCATGGVNTEGAPECTLRAAIQEANASGPVDEIAFAIPASDPGAGGGSFVISPATGLPYLSQTVSLDATTQPGFAGTPIVVVDGSASAPNSDGPDGLLIDGDDVTVRGLVIRDWNDDGIEIHGDDNTIVGNHVFSSDDGILIELGSGNLIGGPNSDDRNVVSGNRKHGVSVDGGHDNVVSGNYIGLDPAGGSALPNARNGVEVWDGADETTVGPGNVISGNVGTGIRLADTETTTIHGNLVGLDAAGITAIGNTGAGILVEDTNGTTSIGSGNVISGNGGDGITSDPGSASIVIDGNRIGTNSSGSAAMPNAGAGAHLDTDDVVVRNNQVSGNTGNGLELEQEGALVTANLIGTDSGGSGPLGNGGSGIATGSGTTGSLIGGIGPGDGNIIAFNGDHGVVLANHPGTAAAIVGNTIFSNGGLGIDLPKVTDGADPNDAGDGDSGPNDLLNHPVMTGAEEAGGDVYVTFDLDVPDGWYRVEFLIDGGATFASAAVIERSGIVSSFDHSFPGPTGTDVIATATRCVTSGCGDAQFTSEFSESASITVGNHRPELDPVEAQSVDEHATLSFTATATDPDPGSVLTFSLDGAPAGAAVDPVTGELTWAPDETQGPASHTFDIVVTDDGSPVSLSDTTPVTVTVGEVNETPDLADLGDHSVAEGSLLVVAASATDPDLPANNLTYGLIGAPSGVVIDPGTGEVSWTPDETQGPGLYTFQVTVVDDGAPALSDIGTTTVTVEEVNEPPVVTHPGDQSHAEGATVTLPVAASDPDLPANTLTYAASGLPPGLVIDPVTGVISGEIEFHANASSPYEPTVTVSDDGIPGASHSTTFTWDTANTNRPPQLGPVDDQTVGEQTTLTFLATASDPDAATLITFDLSGEPSGAVIDPVTGQFAWTPTEGQGPGTYTFDIIASDNDPLLSLSDSATLTVTVTEVNRAPVLADPGDHTVAEGSTLVVAPAATDPDLPANTLTYGLVGAPSGMTINPATGLITWTPGESQGPNVVTFTITVSDNGSPGLTDQETITVTVQEVNETPQPTNPGTQSNPEGAVVDLAIAATDVDLPANTLTYSAIGLPPGLSISAATGRITGEIQYHAAAATPHTTTVTVTDNGAPNRNASVTFTWHTPNTNRPPHLDTIPSRIVDEMTTLVLSATATDPDAGTAITYSAQGAPSGSAIHPVTGVFTWAPTEIQGPNSYTFEITATDDDVMTLDDTITVTIEVAEVNIAPVANDDAGTTDEDTPITIAVLANDTDEDLPENRLGITAVDGPSAGTADVTRGGQILYSPPANFHGPVEVAYTVSDGSATATARVTITVLPVNDTPVAGDDEYRLVEYQPAKLDVLANDSDADGERLMISLVSLPDIGTARVEGDQIVYEPRNGWTGAVEIGYAVRDPHGASATAVAEVIVGDEVLVGARALATNLGVDLVNFEPPAPTFDTAALSLINLDGITLLADSFFQTVDALRIPLGFLGVTVAMIVGLGATADVPALVFGTRRRHWAVVRLGRQQRLPAYSEPGGRKVVYNYDPTAAGIISIGKTETVGNTHWLPVDTPNGKAYIYRKYLTEQLDLQAFLDDPRPSRLVHELADRLRKGRNIDSIVSSEGLVIALTGSPSQIAPEQLASLMGDSRLRHLANIGRAPTTPEEFTVAVAQPFLEAYDATPEISSDVAHSRSALIPTECWNFPYLAVGTAGGVQPWLVFFEYRDGKPLIAGLGIDE